MVAWQVKALATKLEDPSSIPRTHMAEAETRLLKAVL